MNKHTSLVLVIDDDPIVRLTLESLLEGAGYRVEMAENGSEGLKKAKDIQPDVILVDVMMPGMDGYEVCRILRADPQLAEVPIFMITSLDDRNSRLAGLSAGADDFLSKPIDRLELEIRFNVLKRVDRYRHLLDEREKLKRALAQLTLRNAQLHKLSQQVLMAQEIERRNVALELHDEIGQIVTGLKLILEKQNVDSLSLLEQARPVANELLQRVREMALKLRPTVLDDFGLSAALDWLFKRLTRQTGLTIYHNVDPLSERRFDRTIETAAFHVAQEALTNIARHAGVNEANVILTIDPSHLQLSISDTGKGFNPKALEPGSSSGLSGMEERVKLAGGTFSLQSTPKEGTLILVDFGLNPGE
jgi:signal transduction histidine kinase